MKRFIQIRSYSLFRNKYMFLDHETYPSDNLFAMHKLDIRFGKEFARKGSPYRVITVTVPKSQAALFEKLMEEDFENHLLLKGYRDYSKVYQELWVNNVYPKLCKGAS